MTKGITLRGLVLVIVNIIAFAVARDIVLPLIPDPGEEQFSPAGGDLINWTLLGWPVVFSAACLDLYWILRSLIDVYRRGAKSVWIDLVLLALVAVTWMSAGAYVCQHRFQGHF